MMKVLADSRHTHMTVLSVSMCVCLRFAWTATEVPEFINITNIARGKRGESRGVEGWQEELVE